MMNEIESFLKTIENNKDVLVFPETLPIHKQLRLKRYYEEFTLRELASMLGMGVSTLSEVEAGKRRVPYKYMERVKRYLYNEMYSEKEFIQFIPQ